MKSGITGEVFTCADAALAQGWVESWEGHAELVAWALRAGGTACGCFAWTGVGSHGGRDESEDGEDVGELHVEYCRGMYCGSVVRINWSGFSSIDVYAEFVWKVRLLVVVVE